MNTSPSPPSGADNTGASDDIDEILFMVWEHAWDAATNETTLKAPVVMEKAKQAIQNLIAQEATKARIDEWQRLDVGVNISKKYVQNRIAQLTAHKESKE